MRRAFTRVPQQQPLSIFLFFLCVFSGCTYALAVHSHHESEALSQFTVWCPGFAALCTCLLLRIPLGTLGWGWPARRFLRLAYFLPLIYAAPVYLLTWLVIRCAFSLNSFEAAMADTYGLGRWPALGTFGVALPLLFTITVIGEAVWALGEEHWMARVPVSQASAAVRLPRRLSDLRIDLGSVALSGNPLDRL